MALTFSIYNEDQFGLHFYSRLRRLVMYYYTYTGFVYYICRNKTSLFHVTIKTITILIIYIILNPSAVL